MTRLNLLATLVYAIVVLGLPFAASAQELPDGKAAALSRAPAMAAGQTPAVHPSAGAVNHMAEAAPVPGGDAFAGVAIWDRDGETSTGIHLASAFRTGRHVALAGAPALNHQDAHATLRGVLGTRLSASPRETPKITEFEVPTNAPRATAPRQFTNYEAKRQALARADRQQAAQPRRSWVARHKVLTAVLIGAAPFVTWGALVWHACNDGGC